MRTRIPRVFASAYSCAPLPFLKGRDVRPKSVQGWGLTRPPKKVLNKQNTYMKSTISSALRSLGLLHISDRIFYLYQRRKHKQSNQEFEKANPDVVLPPDYMMFESYGLNYTKYYENGRKTAQWIIDIVSPFIKLENKKVLDWGCGPARVVRHMPTLLGDSNKVFGTDYNPKTIQWCAQFIKSVEFSKNELDPPTPYDADTFDLIYGISIFTHLSEEKNITWFEELIRVSNIGAVFFLTTQGDAYLEKMTEKEKEVYNKGEIVERGKVVEGHRVFSTFHPPSYMRTLFEKHTKVLKHIPGVKKEWGIEQDVWVLKKES